MSGVRSSGSLTGHWARSYSKLSLVEKTRSGDVPAGEYMVDDNRYRDHDGLRCVFRHRADGARPGAVGFPILSESLASTEVPSDDDRSSAEEEQRRSLPRDVAGDIWRFFSTGSTYATLGLGLAASLGVKPLDANAVPAGEPPPPDYDVSPDDVFNPGNLLGSTVVQLGGALATYGIGAWANKPGVAELGRDLVRAQLLAGDSPSSSS